MTKKLMEMGYKALKEQGVNEATYPPDQLRPNTPTPKPSIGLSGDVFRSVPFGDDSLPPLNLARKGVPGTNFNQYAILPGVPTKSPKRPMKEKSKEQSPDQKAFADLLTPESAKDYLNQYPPVPKMRADQGSLEKHLQGKDSGVVHPRHQHTQLPDLKPGDKGYMNRGMMMEMGYKALKEAMTNPLADQNPLRNPAQSQDPNRGLGLITLRLR